MENLTTEQSNPASASIDAMDSLSIVELMNRDPKQERD
jgi:N-acetylmuramic acid 6-phosphate (MurNAc-6-P) etherase